MNSTGQQDHRPKENEMTARALTARPAAGSAAHNQYGTFAVSYATEKQTRYIESILSRKDTSSLVDGLAAQLWDQVEHNRINKTAASAIIDMLLELPDAKPVAATHDLGRPATDKQKQFVRSLLAEREGNEKIDSIRLALNIARENNTLNAEIVSNAITMLLAIPANTTKVPDGRYALPAQDGHFVFYRVEAGEGKWDGRTFVSQLIGSVGSWDEAKIGREHAQSILARIAVNVEEAARMFGIKAKACGYCASPLSNPQSRAAGYGETCAHNHGFNYPTLSEALRILEERGETV